MWTVGLDWMIAPVERTTPFRTYARWEDASPRAAWYLRENGNGGRGERLRIALRQWLSRLAAGASPELGECPDCPAGW